MIMDWKDLNKKKIAALYIDEVEDTQMQVFICAVEQGYDLVSFTYAYMTSFVRQKMDEISPIHCTITANEIMTESDKLCLDNVKKTDDPYDIFTAEWLASFYVRAQYELWMPSSEVVKKWTPEFILSRYNVLHDLDMSLVIKKLQQQN